MNKFTSNLAFIRQKEGLTQEAMADKLNLKKSTYSNYENGHSKPELDTFLSISQILKIPMDNLYYKDISKQQQKEYSVVNDSQSEYKKGKWLPLISIEAMAGVSKGDYTALAVDDERYQIPEFQKRSDFLIRITGTSMSPKYYNGDIVACKKIPTETFIQWGKVYIMDTVQGALCKRLFQSEKGDKYIKVVSDNDSYPPFEMTKKEIRSLAIVVGVLRLE